MASSEGKVKKDTDILYVRIGSLKKRLDIQCERLGISQAAITKQALTKFLEEEEKIQAINQKR